MSTGILLINLGTPADPSIRSIRKYLSEFLSDKRIITLNPLLRNLLLYGYILPFKAKQSAKAYQAIWTNIGSPLLFNSLNLATKIQQQLGKDYIVSLGMRYGKPSIPDALNQLEQCDQIIVIPLYPQYASSTTESSIEKVFQSLEEEQKPIRSIKVMPYFYNHPQYIEAQSEIIKPYLADYDFILFSYHGLPEKHLLKTGCNPVCKTDCTIAFDNNTTCYRAQCLQTTSLIAKKIHLSSEKYTTSFQSRLGKATWIKPYTDEILAQLVKRNIKNIAITCPSFIVDCVETLEEIALRASALWKKLGGNKLTLIPCLNDNPIWVTNLTQIIYEQTFKNCAIS